ncbi:MAG: tetratricopeptide repeat protein [Phycisphaerales bacterium JB040]
MAAKVNVKFVTILGASLVVFAGVVGVAGYLLVFKSAAENARIGDRLAEQGEWDQARRAYSKAVNKEPTNAEYLNKWAESISNLTPESETTYRDRLMNDLMAAYMQLAQNEPANIAAQEQYLGFLLERFLLGPAELQSAMGVVDRANNSIVRLEANPPAGDDWKTLYRYRAIPLANVISAGGELERDLYNRVRTDLETALGARPGDEETAVALSWWHAAQSEAEAEAGLTDRSIESLDNAIGVLKNLLEHRPIAPRAMIELLIREHGRDVARATRGMLPDRAQAVENELLSDMAPALPPIADAIIASEPGDVDPNLLLVFSTLEQSADPRGGLAQSRRIAEHLTSVRPDDARIRIAAGELAERSGDSGAALEHYDHLARLSNLPVSLEGFVRISLRREAMFRRARARLSAVLQNPGGDNTQALERAVQDRQEYARQVAEDDAYLMMLDGLIAHARGELTAARDKYRDYNNQTLQRDPRGLWRQTQVAMEMRLDTEAETLLTRMLEIQPGNRTAMLAMAEVQLRLGNEQESLRQFELIAQIEPENEGVQERIAYLRPLVRRDDGSPMAAYFDAIDIRSGEIDNDPTLGPVEEAAAYLAERVKAFGYNERLSIELIQAQLDLGRIEEARETARLAAEANPGSQLLDQFTSALQSDSVEQALLTLVDLSERTDAQKALTKYRVFLSLGKPEEAREQFDRAVAQGADDPEVVEYAFEIALGSGDFETAEAMAEAASRLNIDRAEGAIFRARLTGARGDHDEAIRQLDLLVAQGYDDTNTLRILANQHALNGDLDVAIATIENALSLNSSNPGTRLQHVQLLDAAGRTEDALAAVREARELRNAPRAIENAWLTLEARAGGPAGRAEATARRETIRQTEPDNRLNNAALAELYILARRFEDARPLIDEIREQNDELAAVLLDMRWHADQGRLLLDTDNDGQRDDPVDGISAAQSLFQDYLLERPEDEITADTYLAYARFMIARDQLNLAMPAIEQARAVQAEGRFDAERLLGDLYFTRSRFSDAAEAFSAIVEAGADTPTQEYRKRLIESMLRQEFPPFDEALAQLDQISETDLTTMLQRAEILSGLGREAEARSMLDQAVQRYPQSPLVYVRRAEANLGNPALEADVNADLNAALRVDPDNWRALRVRGMLRVDRDRKAGRPIGDEAIADIRAAVDANPDLEQLLFGLMNEQLKMGRGAQAASLADSIIAKRSDDAQLMLNCARVFANHEQWDRATGYTQMAWDQSKNLNVGVLLIDSYARLTPPRASQAEAIFNELRRLVPPDQVNSMLMLCTEATVRNAQGRANSTVRALTSALQTAQRPEQVLSWAQNVQRVFRDDPETAASTMQQIAADPALSLPEDTRPWLDFVIAQQLVRSPENAEEGASLLRTLRDLDDANPLALLAYRIEGNVWYAADDFQRARAVWDEGLARFPEDWELLNNQAYLLALHFDSAEEALPLAQRSAELAPDALSPHDTLARIYTELGRFDDALRHLERAGELAADRAQRVTVAMARARYHLARGEIEEARKTSQLARNTVFETVGMEEMAEQLDELDAEIDSAAP